MVSVAELLELTLFDDFTLVAGGLGLSNELNTVAILEYESFQKNYEVFSAGDFILTSLFFAKDDPSLITDALLSLMRLHVSGIAVKTMFYTSLPKEVLKAADRMHIPVFLFHKAYMEDLIISANELLKSKLQYLVFEEKVRALIDTSPSAHTVTETAHEINYHFLPNIISVYLTPRSLDGKNTISDYFHRLVYKRYRLRSLPNQYSYVKFHQGMLLLLSFEEVPSDLVSIIQEQLKLVDLTASSFYIGIADGLHPLKELNLAITQSVTANLVCRLKEKNMVCYSACGIYQFLAPLLSDASICDICRTKMNALETYDAKYTSNLLPTLKTFVSCNGSIKETADVIYQHPNTVRYRLQKICSIWSVTTEDLYHYAFTYVHLYELMTLAGNW